MCGAAGAGVAIGTVWDIWWSGESRLLVTDDCAIIGEAFERSISDSMIQ